MLALVTRNDEQSVFLESIRLAIAMLEGGNSKIQEVCVC